MSHICPIQVMKLNESILIFFFFEISCSGSNVSLHWYHKGSIVYPALTAEPALTPYYPTADSGLSGNIWLTLKAAKIYFDLKKKKKKTEFFVSMYTMCFILVISFWFDCHNFNADVHLCCTCLFLLIKSVWLWQTISKLLNPAENCLKFSPQAENDFLKPCGPQICTSPQFYFVINLT